MTTSSYDVFSQEAHRLQAIMALFKGEKTSQVSTTFGIRRSDLYKFRKGARVEALVMGLGPAFGGCSH